MSVLVDERASSSLRLFGFIVVISDVLAICCSSYGANFAYHSLVLQAEGSRFDNAFGYGVAVALILILVESNAADYRVNSLGNLSIKRLIWHWIVSLSLFLTTVFLLKIGDVFSRGAFMIFAFVGFVALSANRMLVGLVIRKWLVRGLIQPQRFAVIGAPAEIGHARLQVEVAATGCKVAECFKLDEEASPGSLAATVDRVIALSRDRSIDAILIALPWSRSMEIETALSRLREQALPVMLLPDLQASRFVSQPSIFLSELPAYVIKRQALSLSEQSKKRIFDVIVATLGLTVLWPLYAAVAVAIKLDSRGPVFFRQRRDGFNNREFSIFKFRTMQTIEDDHEVRQAVRNDPRITRVGALLRRTSIDELPQLINVLRGEMSIVGPRPHAVTHNATWTRMVDHYALRHHIKPGITGLAQVNGCRGECETYEKIKLRVQYDLEYIDRWSLWLDVQIVLKTIMVLGFQRSAY